MSRAPGSVLGQHLYLRAEWDTPPEKWLTLGKYCLIQSGQVPEVVDMLKATGTLRWRPRAAPEAEPQDPLPTPALEALWQTAWSWGRQWPQTLRTWLQWGAAHGDPAHWQPGWHGLQRRLSWVHGLLLEWLTGVTPTWDRTSPRWKAEWAVLAFPEGLWGALRQAAQAGRGRALTPGETRRLEEHAQLTLPPLVERFQTPLVRTAFETERAARLQGASLPLAQDQGAVAVHQQLADAPQGQRWAADWTRTVRTEVMDAYTQGAVQTLVQQDQAHVYRIVSARACDKCRSLYVQSDGAPKVFLLSDLIANGTNEGRKQAEWLPVIAATHPSCVCSAPLPYSATIETGLFTAMRERARV